jgi:hypothetical protein
MVVIEIIGYVTISALPEIAKISMAFGLLDTMILVE